jgi:hypothetical protein
LQEILKRGDLPENGRKAGEQFLREYRLAQDGEDPSGFGFLDKLEDSGRVE